MSQIGTITAPRPYARLGANHGYSIDGDVALLHADVEVLDAPSSGHWALQLWACDSPYTGGPVSGVKIAEAELATGAEPIERVTRLAADAQAQVPGGQRDYAMVLVLASGERGHFNQIHDFANYPARQRFITPHLTGSVEYAIDGEQLVLKADAMVNPREADNLSGSLRLDLWALPEPYIGGRVDGVLLGGIDLGRVAGQSLLPEIAASVPFTAPPAGEWHVVMMLREWAGPAGYVTRDYARFAVPYVVPSANPIDAVIAVEDAGAPAPSTVATPVEPVSAPTKSDEPARVSVNTASAAQLTSIKGVSKAVANAIVRGRPYKSIDALLDVRGIGPKLLEKLRPLISL